MSTLWKRANGPQFKMLRIVSGAVLNTAHAHPGKLPDKRFARSVAKRAVGTISAQWVEMLSEGASRETPTGTRRESLVPGRDHRSTWSSDDTGRSETTKAAPFTKLCRQLGRQITPLRMSGDAEAAEAALKTAREEEPFAYFIWNGDCWDQVSDVFKNDADVVPAYRARSQSPEPSQQPRYVRKTKGSSWHGRIVGTYSTSLTPIGYAVESYYEPGAVQIYPASALEPWTPPAIPAQTLSDLAAIDTDNLDARSIGPGVKLSTSTDKGE